MKQIITFILGVFLTNFCYSNGNINRIEKDPQPKYNNKLNLPDHPRLLFSMEEEAQILKLAKSEPILSDLIEILREQADKVLTRSLLVPASDGSIKNLHQSREAIRRTLTLSMAYRIFNEEKYASRVEQELLNVCGFKSWNPHHFLDVAEMTNAVAIGYDWCFDNLSVSSKLTIERTLKNLAFLPALKVYKNGDEKSWAKRTTNWNTVCNSGMVAGAIAVGDVYPDDAKKIIDYAIQLVPNNLKHFAPNGVYYEGPVYWAYTLSYFSFLSDNLTRNFNTDSGLSDLEGISETCHYYFDIMSPSKRVFNFADAGGGDKALLTPIYFFFSKKFNKPEIAEFYRDYLKETIDGNIAHHKFSFSSTFFLSIPWYDPAISSSSSANDKLKVLEGDPDILVFNEDKENPNELFLAAKGGDPDMDHNQLDVGTFVLECEQVKWAIDLGSENYNLPSFWDYAPNGVRWNYFRNTNLSHNTLNIDGQIAFSEGDGQVVKSSTESNQPFGIIDMSSCYNQQAQSVKRGFKMMSPDIILMQDEITTMKTSSTIYWRFLTKASVLIKDNSAELSQDGKTFYIYSVSNEQSNIKTLIAKPYSDAEKPINGVTIIEISVTPNDNKQATIPILMSKDLSKILEFKDQVNDKLDNWK